MSIQQFHSYDARLKGFRKELQTVCNELKPLKREYTRKLKQKRDLEVIVETFQRLARKELETV